MLKKKLSCNGCLKKHKENDTQFIQFQGKHSDEIQSMLSEKNIISSDDIVIIGDY